MSGPKAAWVPVTQPTTTRSAGSSSSRWRTSVVLPVPTSPVSTTMPDCSTRA